MLGVVGDLGSRRIIAWEISSEMDLNTFENEVKHYVSDFSVLCLALDVMSYKVGEFSYSVCVGDFLYFDLFTGDVLSPVLRDCFFRDFNRTF